MPDIKIKGYSGNDLVYQNVDKIYFRKADDSGTVPFSYGEAVDNIPIQLDFANGENQTITAPEGTLVRSAVIEKPESLKPENIRKGENVCGIDGEFESYAVPEERTVELDFRDITIVHDAQSLHDQLIESNLGEVFQYQGEDGEFVHGQYYQAIDEYEAFDPYSCPATATEVTSGTELTASVECNVGDLVIAAFAIRSALVSLGDGWTLISTSQSTTEINSSNISNQTLSFAYKYATSATESITVTQTTAGRIYINMVAINGGSGLVDIGYQYKSGVDANKPLYITFERPTNEIVLWGATRGLWATSGYPIWEVSNDACMIQLGSATQSRLLLAIDTSKDDTVTFGVGSELDATDAVICGALSIQLNHKVSLKGIDATEVPILNEIVVEPSEDGKSFSKVTVMKPDNLTSENIAKNKMVGGVTGTNRGGDYFINYMSDDGTETLYIKPIMHGDTCGDIIALGLCDKPTKEAEGIEYTFLGWSSSIGGAVSSDPLTNVTENRTVYAVFKSEAVIDCGVCGDNLTWRVYPNYQLSITGTGDMYDFSQYGAPWSSLRSKLTSAVLSGNITSIGKYAFYMNHITSVTIPSSVKRIGANAFQAVSCSSITIPNGVEEIGDSAFSGVGNLTSITIPSSVISIGYRAFYNTSLTSATFNDTTTWYVTQSASTTSGTTLTSSNLSNKSTAATYLKSTYSDYYWHKN